jgi:hypothetical protein
MTEPIEVDAVRHTLSTRSKIVYWRYRPARLATEAQRGDDGRWLACVSQRDKDGLYRALGYSPTQRPPNGNVELGRHASKREAVDAAHTYIRDVLIREGQ